MATSSTVDAAGVDAEAEFKVYNESQRTAAQISRVVDAKTIVANNTIGTLSTLSCNAPEGFPVGAIVAYVAAPEDGLPLLYISSIS